MAASSSTTPNNECFDVFINHRGVDTKKTFAKCLHRDLVSKGLRAFIDDVDMEAGYGISSQLEHAVKTASVHVAVFSPRYAESEWCLKELVLMFESQAPIIPVFYRVATSEVKWITGKYGEDLQTHEQKERHDSNIVKKWRETLQKVAGISGLVLDECNGVSPNPKTISVEELEPMLNLVDKVVKSVLKKVKRPMSELYVADFPTGLVPKLQDFENKVMLPQRQSGKPPIFGIVGLGGVGKSTLAKELFNRKKSEYAASCFLFLNEGKLESLQSELLRSLTGLDQRVDNVDIGKKMLMQPLKKHNALVILDGVHNTKQLKALLPVQSHELCSGSLILITSRNRDVLRARVDALSFYKLTELETQHSRELFCSHAFSKTNPPPGFEDLVDQFLKSCNGLPSFLTDFGTLLCGKDISMWKGELESLPKKIKKYLLKISYDTLEPEEQQIFLDIACVFIGQDKETAISIWNGSGTGSSSGLQSLQDKSFVEMDGWNNIQMHDRLRDMGRDLAASSSPARIWHKGTKSVIDYLSQRSYEITVRAILLDSEYSGDYKDDVIDIDDSQKVTLERVMKSVQILYTKGSLLEPIFRRMELVTNLIWLRWENCPHSSLPSWVPIQNLRVLRVSQSRLKTLPQAPMQLPVCLEEFLADGCVELESISGLEQATKLRVLSVLGCSKLEELPNLERLVYLEELRFGGCSQLKSIRGLEKATKFRVLDVSGCSELEQLQARGCVQLKSIMGLEQATKLRMLNVSGCSEFEELPGMERLVSLEALLLDGCVQMKSIRGLEQATKLRQLIVSGCSKLEELPGMERLVSLEDFRAKGCMQLKSIRGLEKATKLRVLDVSGCSELEQLQASGCVQLKSIDGLEQATKLRVLNVSWCSELEELQGRLVSLEELCVEGCVQLKIINGLEQATKLRMLDVNGCSELKQLQARGCVQLKSIKGLEQATKLRVLDVSGCSELEELPSMGRLVSLEDLRAKECFKLKSIRGLAKCAKLRLLHVSGCSELEELLGMERLVFLKEFWADGCVQLKSIRGLEKAKYLRVLNVSGCSKLEELPSTKRLVSLEELCAEGCVQLKSIKGLAWCTKLQEVIVKGCSELEELEDVEHLSLKRFDVSNCPKLVGRMLREMDEQQSGESEEGTMSPSFKSAFIADFIRLRTLALIIGYFVFLFFILEVEVEEES